jgi:hypothetical protein
MNYVKIETNCEDLISELKGSFKLNIKANIEGCKFEVVSFDASKVQGVCEFILCNPTD